jgi:putative ABC transport system permease protein
MRAALAAASLLRHRTRTLLAVLGVAVSAAMLLDMVMLSSGMRESFRSLLLSRGFQLRLAPKGTLPFDTEATIADAAATERTLRESGDIVTVSPVLGASVHVPVGARTVPSLALGVHAREQGDYELLEGSDLVGAGSLVANDELLAATGARLGDTLTVAAGYDPQLRTYAGTRRLLIAGRARFLYAAAGQLAVALPLETLQAMSGPERADRVSLFMVKARDGADVEAVRRWIERTLPRVSAISTSTALAEVDERLSYFRQLAYILGSVSLVVGFLLVTTLVTVSVNERLGEIAVMRAIGVARVHIVAQIVLEGLALMAAGSILGLLLGLATARYLDSILAAFPGLPAAIDFFLFQPRAAWTALGLLALCGVAAGIYPAWRGASLPIAATLRQDAIG